ncbi:MAG: GYF domain-containing protein [Polyangiaceae bacterium]
MTKNQWRWVAPDGFEYTGDLSTLKTALAEGRLTPSTMVSPPSLGGWLPASEVPELGAGGFAPAAPTAQPLPAFMPEDDMPTVRDNPIPEPLPEAPPVAQAWGTPSAPPVMTPSAPPVQSRAPDAPPELAPAKRLGWGFTIGGAVFGALVLGGIGLLGVIAKSNADKAPDPLASASVAAAPSAAHGSAPAALPKACKAGHAKLLEKSVVPKVPLEAEAVGEGRIAVAFAHEKNQAKALVLAADTLEKQSEKSQESHTAVVGAQAVANADDIELVVDTEHPGLHAARSVVGDKPLRIGATTRGIARTEGDSEPEVVWPLTETDVTAPRIESHAATGHFVALRAGGQAGKLLAGWLSPDGNKKTDLSSPEISAHALGTPTVAVGASGALLLVAAKSEKDSPWQIFAGHAALGAVPDKLSHVALGSGDSPRISPAATALAGGGWLLQYTEGPDDAHSVFVQVLAADLAPKGEPTRVSPQGADAGQGRVFSHGAHAASFFLVSTGDAHELWAAPLDCD